MAQVEVDCGPPALWQEVQARRSSSSLLLLFYSHQPSAGSWGPWDGGKPAAACCHRAGRKRRDRDWVHKKQTPPVLPCTMPPPPPSLVCLLPHHSSKPLCSEPSVVEMDLASFLPLPPLLPHCASGTVLKTLLASSVLSPCSRFPRAPAGRARMLKQM